LWTGTTGGSIQSPPAVANSTVYVGSSDGKLYAFNAAGCGSSTCTPLWTASTGPSILGSGPAVANGVVYIGSFVSDIFAFNAAGCGQATCSPLWKGKAGNFISATPSIANGVVYIGSGDGILSAFKASGCGSSVCQPLWTGAAVGAQAAMISAPTVANGLVYIGENNGMVEVFNAKGCGKSFCLPVTQLLTQNEQIVSSTPAIVNGTVYFGSADQFSNPIGRLYVFRLSQSRQGKRRRISPAPSAPVNLALRHRVRCGLPRHSPKCSRFVLA
jgi:outer membrane protein assembly factor BamB